MKLSAPPRSRLLAALCAAVLTAPMSAAVAAPPPAPRIFAIPMPSIAAPAEPYGTYQGQSICKNTAEPGVLAFQKLVLTRYVGSRNLGITRGCGQGGRSEHKEGRAWDWGVRVDRPTEKAYAEDLIGWLLAPDAQGVRAGNARRLGIMYIIWNHQIWSASQAAIGWRSYFGPNPHTDHVHLSWTWPGAQQLTSYWTGTPYGIGAAGGQLDPLWGSGGWQAAAPTDPARLVNALRWSDGRQWLVSQSTANGDVVIEERLPSGALGSAFGGSGRTRVPVPSNTLIRSAALTSNGTVVVAGPTAPPVGAVAVPTQDMFAMRVTTSGRIDTTFGSGGMVLVDLGGVEDVNAIELAGTDVVLAGSTTTAAGQAMAVVRLTSTGARAAFGVGGVFVAPVGGLVTADSALPRPDGSIVVGCRTATETCVAKLTRTGILEPTWGGAGVTGVAAAPAAAVLAAGPGDTVYATFLLPDGNAGIYRLNSVGFGDPTFGSGEFWRQDFRVIGCTNRPTALTVRSDGSAIVAGVLDGCGKGFVARLTIDGPLDPTWGSSGIATFDSVGGQPIAGLPDVALQADGHVVVFASGGTDPALAPSIGRFTTSGPVPARTLAVGSTDKLTYGAALKLTAVIRSTSNYTLASDVPVRFETQAADTGAWTPLGTTTSTVGGLATFDVTPATHASYRVVSDATSALFAATSASVAVRVSYALTPTVVTPPKLYARQGITLALTAAPARPGRRVWLQRYDKTRWRTIARPVLDANSAASFRFASQTPTTVKFRWVIMGDAQLDGLTTSTLSVVWSARPVVAPPVTPGATPPVVTPPASPPVVSPPVVTSSPTPAPPNTPGDPALSPSPTPGQPAPTPSGSLPNGSPPPPAD